MITMCPRGDLNTETGEISAACSPSGPLPGLCMAVWRVRNICPQRRWLQRLGSPQPGWRLGQAAVRDELWHARAWRRPAGKHLRRAQAGSRVQNWLSRRVMLAFP